MMSQHTCIIVEDEPKLQEVLQAYIAQVPLLRLVCTCKNAFEAMKALRENPVDILFLDIQMPQLSGLQLLKTLDRPIKTIITTAHAEFAVDGFDIGVTDYLLKPISFKRFMKAVFRTLSLLPSGPYPTEAAPLPPMPNFLFVKIDRRAEKLLLHEIWYLEAYGNYVKIYCQNRMVLATDTLTHLQTLLPPQLFFRVGKSFIVSRSNISSYSGEQLQVNNQRIPISKLQRNAFLQWMAASND